MATTEIDAYEILYSANTFSPRIGLKNKKAYIGQMVFKPNGGVLPTDKLIGSQPQIYYHLDDFQNALDILRNEKPVYLFFSGTGGGFENGIRTTEEAVGEDDAS